MHDFGQRTVRAKKRFLISQLADGSYRLESGLLYDR
jgi:hypothetical protein